MVEEWRNIPGYAECYYVSNLGRVCSTMYGSIRIKKLHKNKDGYLKVKVGNKSFCKVAYVHRLVASSFIGSIENMEVNHLDGNKDNNCIFNLEICTHKENMNHAFNILNINNHGMTGRFGKLHHLSKPVYQLDKDCNIIKRYDSLMDASRELKLDVANICKAALGKAHSCGGFKWRYKL